MTASGREEPARGRGAGRCDQAGAWKRLPVGWTFRRHPSLPRLPPARAQDPERSMEARPKTPARPNVYQYDDFRAFLKAAFEALKAERPDYSYRKFAREAGISNPGYLLDVTIGKRTLSRNMAARMAPVFGLNEQETEFFFRLAEFGQARRDADRQALYQDLLQRRNRSRFARFSPSLVKYYQDYRYSLVRCAVNAF